MPGVGLEPGGFRPQPLGTFVRHFVVTPQPAINDLFASRDDKPLFLKPVNNGVQGSRPHLHPALRDGFRLGQQGVAVHRAAAQGREDQERLFAHLLLSHAKRIFI